MGKVVKTIGLAVAGIALVATGVGALALPGLGAITLFGVSTATLALAGAGLATLGGMLSRPKAPAISTAAIDRLNVSITLDAPRKGIVGETAMATDLRYQEWWGDQQEYCSQVLLAAAHWCEAIEQIWINNELAWTVTGGVQGQYAGYLEVDYHLRADASSVFNKGWSNKWGSHAVFVGCATLYLQFKVTGNSKKAQSPFSSGVPGRITVIGKGAPIYDPRLDDTAGGSGAMRADDQSTWAYAAGGEAIGRNNALALLFYLLGWRINGKVSVGLGIPANRIDLDSFITGANLCDELVTKVDGTTEPRYRCDGIFSEGDDPRQVIANYEASMNGKLRDTGGKLSLQVYHNDLATPVIDLTEDDVLGDFTWAAGNALNDRKNVVKGRYPDPSSYSLFQLIDYEPASIPSLDGIDRFDPFDLAFVQSPSQCERLAKQRLQRQLYAGAFSANLNAKGWGIKDGDVVTLTFPPLGFAQKLFRVDLTTVDPSGVSPVKLIEENAAIYAWDREESPAVQPAVPNTFDLLKQPIPQAIDDAGQTADWELVTGGGKPEDNATKGAPAGTYVGSTLAEDIEAAIETLQSSPQLDTVPPAIPTGLTLATLLSNTSSTAIVTATWDANGEADFGSYDAAIAVNGGGFIEFPTKSTTYQWNVQPGSTVAVKVSATDKAGNASGWSDTKTITAAKDATPPAAPTGLSYNASVGAIFLAWVNPADTDLAQVQVWSATTSSSGVASLVATVNAEPSVAGGVAISGLAAGSTHYYWLKAIDTSGNASVFSAMLTVVAPYVGVSDLAPGLSALQMVTTLPVSTGGGRVVYLSTDHKLYRDTGAGPYSGWDRSTDGADILAGSVRAAQIAAGAIVATKLGVGGDSLNPDPLFQDADLYGNYGAGTANPASVALSASQDGWYQDSSAGSAARTVLGVSQCLTLFQGNTHWTGAANGKRTVCQSTHNVIPLTAGKSYELSALIANALGQNIYVQIACVDTSGAGLTFPMLTLASGGTAGTYTTTFTAPPNCVGGLIQAYNHGTDYGAPALTANGYAGVANVQVREQLAGTAVIDGTLTAAKIQVESLTGDRFQAETITGDKISSTTSLPASLTIGTTGFNLGVVQQSAAAAGAGGNRVPNSQISNGRGTAGWHANDGVPLMTSFAANSALGYNYLDMRINATAAGQVMGIAGDYTISNPANNTKKYCFAVTPGERLAVSCATGSMQNAVLAQLSVAWIDSAGNIGTIPEGIACSGVAPGTFPNKIGGFVTVPAGAFQGVLVLRVNSAAAGDTRLVFAAPMVTSATPGQTVLPNYQAGPDFDPAATINANTTQIDPGKITISGATTLANWRNGGDTTKIEGGAIAANTITANKATIGLRGVNIISINFQVSADRTTFSWNGGGYILWTNDAGQQISTPIPAGATQNPGWTYIYWNKINSFLEVAADWGAIQANPDCIMLASWQGYGSGNFVANYGGTIINGDQIVTGSVHARVIQSATITGDLIAGQTITADKMLVSSLSAITANIGLLRTATSGARVEIESNQIRVYDSNNVMRVRLGVW